jgi:hypothetical protein
MNIDNFDQQVRDLAARAPRLAPEHLDGVLRRRIRARREVSRRVLGLAVTAVGLGTGWWLWPPAADRTTSGPIAAVPTPNQTTTVVLPLADGTPLYLILATP